MYLIVLTNLLFLILCHNVGFASNLVSSKYAAISSVEISAGATSSVVSVEAAATFSAGAAAGSNIAFATTFSSSTGSISATPPTSSTGAGMYFNASAISIPI